MNVQTVEQPKTRKRVAGKTTGRQDGKKQKLTLYVTPAVAQRLGVHATMLSMDRSALVESLIVEGCKRFVVHDHGKPADQAIGATVEVSGN